MNIAFIWSAIRYLWEALQIVNAIKSISSFIKKTPTPPKE